MADNDQSKIRYDDFIGNVQPDPAKPESTIMLSGFVGHGPEGHTRVYPDPTLGSWYDIPEGDILHSTPIADSKLGGSYIWVRASSEIKPGSAAPAASEAEAVQPQQAAGVGFDPTPRTFCFVCDLPKAAVAMQPTPATHCYICPPHTWGPCRTALCDNMQAPTPATHCFICPPHTQNCTPATICTLQGHCPPQHSVPPTLCAVPQTLPCSLLCQADPRGGAAPAAMALPHTAATLCTQFGCPPHGPAGENAGTFVFTAWCSLVGCNPATNGCGAQAAAPAAMALPHTAATLCTQFGCPQNGMVPTVWCSWVGCPPHGPAGGAPAALQQANTGVTVCVTDCVPPGNEMMKAAVGMTPTPRTHCRICDPPMMAAAAMQPTPTPQTHCFICPQPHLTYATVCTQIGCPTHQIHCPTQPVVCNLLPTQPVVCGVLPPSFGCHQGGAQPQLEGVMAAPAHPNTAATLCTQQPACPPHPLGTLRTSWFECHTQMAGCTHHVCFQANQPQAAQATVATLCTQVGCPTLPVVCGILPPSFGCTQQGCAPGAAGAPQVQAGAFEGATVICSQPARCTQACMPQAQHGGGVTAATVCTMPPGCPPHTVHYCPPNTVNTPCATFVCPTLGACPTVAACTPNGIFTPFGR
jgi:hypothetical protein